MSTELLAPAGDFDSALAAFDAGADAVYCSLGEFSARAFAKNLSRTELKNLVRVAAKRGKKVYVAFNTVIDEGDLEHAIEVLSVIDQAKPSGIIVQDLGVARICRKYFPNLELHASTQLVAHNLEGVLALGELGFKRVVLARELSLAEIASISKRCGNVELECFIHGALCYSISGLCLFSAMEKNRSGNRGKCAYCCRLPADSSSASKTLPYSMKDLRLGDDVKSLVDASVASLKIEGRMKSHLYVAAACAYYRAILDGNQAAAKKALDNLQTVFSRRTTKLYFDGEGDDPIDGSSLGHVGLYVGKVKRITKDRDGRSWLRFHTLRALEKHDGLQFPSPSLGKPLGFGISEMRTAISRSTVFEVPANSDIEVLLSEPSDDTPPLDIRPGSDVYCSMSNLVKRLYPVPSFRPSDYPGVEELSISVDVSSTEIKAVASLGELEVSASLTGVFDSAKNPDATYGAVEKAFSKLGESDYSLGSLKLIDPERRFVPMSILNDLRRDLVEALDDAREDARRSKVEAAIEDCPDIMNAVDCQSLANVLRIRYSQKVPAGNWDEIVLAITDALTPDDVVATYPMAHSMRLALPVFTRETQFNKLRLTVKRFLREGFCKWEASDLATLRMLKALGVTDITADWTLYAFNSSALASLAELGVKRFVASPENGNENISFLSESGFVVECLAQQSTPLFISTTMPSSLPSDDSAFVSFEKAGLWVTTRRLPRLFNPPRGVVRRTDLSWSAQ